MNESTWTISFVKILWYIWAIWVFDILNIPETQFTILAILMLIDFILWIWRRYIINKKEITSHKAWLWAFKKVSTLLVFLAIALVLKRVNIWNQMYLNTIISIFIISELYSIIWNTYSIRTWNQIKEYDVISKFLMIIWNFIWKYLDEQINETNKQMNKKDTKKDKNNK